MALELVGLDEKDKLHELVKAHTLSDQYTKYLIQGCTTSGGV